MVANPLCAQHPAGCDAIWLAPEDVSDDHFLEAHPLPDRSGWRVAEGIDLDLGMAWATEDEVRSRTQWPLERFRGRE